MPTPAKKVVKLTSWSFSRYSDYKKCPRLAKLKHIDKLKEPPSAPMQRGADIHNQCEAYVKGTLAKLPADLVQFKQEFADLRKMYKTRKLPMIVEDQWAFTVDWAETLWNDWVGCWVRIKLDMARYLHEEHMEVVDYKTGQMKDEKKVEYMEQLELYALAALLLHGHRNPDFVVTVRLWFLDHGVIYPNEEDTITYTIKDIPKLMKKWNARVKPMMNDTKFPPKPNAECKWCFFGQSGKAKKGGPGICEF